MKTDITPDGKRIQIVSRGMAAIEAAERGAALYVATVDGWALVAPERRGWVLRRARNRRSRTCIELFGSTGPRFDAWGGVSYHDNVGPEGVVLK